MNDIDVISSPVILASKIICEENVQSLEDKQMEFATSFDHNTDDLKLRPQH